MALTKETTAATIKKYGAKENDTGNVKVQIALLTQRVQQLSVTAIRTVRARALS